MDGHIAAGLGELITAREGKTLSVAESAEDQNNRRAFNDAMSRIRERGAESADLQRQARPATQEFMGAAGGGWSWETAAKIGDALLKNPVGVTTDVIVQSSLPSLAGMATAILARFSGGSANAAALAGGMGGSAFMEFGNAYAENRAEGLPHEQAWAKAGAKASVIGTLDAISFKTAGAAMEGVLSKAGAAQKAGIVAKEVGRQAGLGMAGEAGGSLAAGQTPDPVAVVSEGIAEVAGAPGEALSQFRRGPRNEEPRDGSPSAPSAGPSNAVPASDILPPAQPDKAPSPAEQALLHNPAAETSEIVGKPAAIRRGASTTFSTETGVALDGDYALVEADELIASHDMNLRPNPAFPAELQPRARDRAASELQINQITQKLNPERLGASPDVATGAPIIGADGLVESGNARTIALQRVYRLPQGARAQAYKGWLAGNAANFGFTAEDVQGMAKPVLVRVRNTPVNRAEFARQANTPTVAAMSPLELAKSDAARLGHLDDLHLTEDGDLTGADNRAFVNRFVGSLAPTEQAGLLDAAGRLSQAGYARVRNAVMARAYGDSPQLMRMVESIDANLRNLSAALIRVAPQVAKAREAIDAGALHDADLTDDLLAAIDQLSQLKADGRSVADYLAQGDLVGDTLSEDARDLLLFLEANLRAPRRVASFISDYFDALAAFGNPAQGSLLEGATAPSMRELIRTVRENAHGNETPAQTATGEPTAGAAAETGDARRSQPDGAQGGATGSAIETLNDEWALFPPESGTLGIPRAQMPQIKGADRSALLQFLRARGIDYEKVSVDPLQLRPTQAEFSLKKTAKWLEVREGVDRSVLISSDNYVLDGHHQWLGSMAIERPQEAIRFSAPIRELLAAVAEFPSVKRSEGAEVIDLGQARADREARADRDFEAALADLGAWVRNNMTGTFKVVPEDTPDLLKTLTALFDAAIRKGYYQFSRAVTKVMADLRRKKETRALVNVVKPQMLQRAFDDALKAYTREPGPDGAQGDLFAQPAAGSTGDLFSGVKENRATFPAKLPETPATPPNFIDWIKQKGVAWPPPQDRLEALRAGYAQAYPQQITRKAGKPLHAMIDGRPYDMERDNFVEPPVASFMPADVLERAKGYVEKYFKNRPPVQISSDDRARAESLLAPLIEQAHAEKVGFDQKVIDITQRAKAIGQKLAPVKKMERAAVKLAVENDFDVSKMYDLLRATIVVRTYAEAQAVLDEITSVFDLARKPKVRTGEGPLVVNGESIASDDPRKFGGYSDVLVNVRLASGVLAEIQINVPEMMAAKEGDGHKLYEAFREAPKDSPLGREIQESMQEFYAAAAAAARKSASERSNHSEIGPDGGKSGRGDSDLPSSASANQPEPGNSTKNPPSDRSPNRAPAGNLSGIGIDSINTTSGDIMPERNNAVKGDRSENSTDGTPGDEGSGAGPAPATGPGGDAGSVRGDTGGRNRSGDRRPRDVGSGAAQPGRPAADGTGAGNERQPAGSDRNRARPDARIPERVIPNKSGGNYRFTDDDLSYKGGWLTKARQNLAAIELLRQLEREGRQATTQEQSVLAKYVGWGASELAQNLFSDKLDEQVRAIDSWESAMQSMEDAGGRLTRGRAGHWQAAQLLSAKEGKPVYHFDYHTITREQLQKAKPDTGVRAWAELRDKLRGLLDDEDWATAARSTQNAHYTSKEIVRSMWDVMSAFGFRGGAVLEPGAGIGVFAGLMPGEVAATSTYTGIEFDKTTGAILKQLFPDEQIRVESYVDTQVPNDFYDVAIGNPPFASTPILADPAYRKHGFALHDYFFAKTIDKVRPGGVVAFVTSRYTLDKQGDKLRNYLADRADLIGAIRLPQTAFKKNAGTEVVTDVLFLQKRQPGAAPSGPDWGRLKPVQTAEGKPFMINEYFADHPNMVLGQHSARGSMRSKAEYTVLPPEGAIEQAFARAAATLPKDIYRPVRGSTAEAAEVAYIDFSPKVQKEGNYYLDDDGRLMVRDEGVGKVVPLVKFKKDGPGLVAKDAALVRAFIPLRDALKQSQYDQLNDSPDWERSLADLNKAYRAFVKAHGNILQNTVTTRNVKQVDEDTGEVRVDPETGEEITEARIYRAFPVLNAVRDDPDWTLVAALEKIDNETGKITPSKFLSERQLNRPKKAEVRSASDALLSVLNDLGKVDVDEIAARLGESQASVIDALGTAIYEDPSEGWVTADAYLSGNVRAKLKQAQAAAKNDRRYERNVQALLANQPVDLAPGDITAALGQPWIAPKYITQFMKEKIGVTVGVRYEPRTSTWHVDPVTATRTRDAETNRMLWSFPTSEKNAATIDYGTPRVPAPLLLEHALTGAPIRVMSRVGVGKDATYVFDKDATEAAQQKLSVLHEAFKSWVWTDADRALDLARTYNDRFNTHVARRFDGAHLTLPGSSLSARVHDHVKRGAWRIIQAGNTYLAHAVGSGKTWASVIALMEQKRLGLINKPMVVVPNHMLQQFSVEWLQLYPAARLAVADEKNFTGDNRRRFVSRVALSDVDGVIITQSAFKLLDLDPEFKRRKINEELAFYRSALEEVGGNPDDLRFDEKGKRIKGKGGSKDPTVKAIEASIERLEQQLAAAMSSEGKDKNVRLDQMGVDFLVVDEAQEYRKLQFVTQRKAKGIDSSGSQRAFDMWLKTCWLEERKPGRSLVMMSGTPVTNTLAEIYTVQRFMGPAALDEKGLGTFDDWAAMFGDITTDIESDPSGQYEQVSRFAKFNNVAELTQMFREFADVLTADHLAAKMGDKRPALAGGSRNIVVTPDIPEHAEYKRELAARLAESRAWKPTFKQPNNPDPVIAIIGDGRLAAIDMRFIKPGLPNNPGSKLNQMIDRVIETWRETKDWTFADPETGKDEPRKGATQMVFAKIGFGDGVAKRRGFDARAWMEKRLRDAGVPPSQVAFMSDFKRSEDKIRLFSAMNKGEVRILVGSDANMGTGVNAQQRLIEMQHLDAPWFPADLTQREGRIIRQGNKNKSVRINAFATKGSYDSVMWQLLARKQRFIDQALSGDAVVRSMDDVSEASQMQLAQAMTAANPKAIELAGAQAEAERLQRLARSHEDTQWALRQRRDRAEATIAHAKRALPEAEALAARVQDLAGEKFSAALDGKKLDKRKDFGEGLLAAWRDLTSRGVEAQTELGTLSGFPVLYQGRARKNDKGQLVDFNSMIGLTDGAETVLWRTDDQQSDPTGMVMRMLNALEGVRNEPAALRSRMDTARDEITTADARLGAPFEFAQLLAEKRAEIERIEAELLADGKPATLDPALLAAAGDRRVLQAIAAADRQSPAPVMSRGQDGGGVDVDEVRALAKRVTAGLDNAAKIIVRQSVDELPAHLREHIRAAGATTDVHAIFDPKASAIYVVADNLSTLDEAEQAIFHDLYGHYGLRAAIGDRYAVELRRLAANNANVRKAAAAIRAQYGYGELLSIEEAVADMAGRNEPVRLLDKLTAALAAGLRKLGLARVASAIERMTDAEVRVLIGRAREFVRGGGKPGISIAERGVPMARASQGQTLTPAQRADQILSAPGTRIAPLEAVLAAPFRLTGIARVLAGGSDRLMQTLGRLVPEVVKQGVVSDYKNPQAVVDRRQAMRGAQARLMRQTGDLLNRLSTLTRGESRVAYEWMNSQDPQSAEYFRQQLPEESIRVLADVEKLIDSLSKEAVALGQLDPAAFERNRFAYLHRSYQKYTAELNEQEVKARGRTIAVLGEQYKGRGMFEPVPMAKIENTAPNWWKRKLQSGRADTALKGEKFVRLERRKTAGAGVAALPGVGPAQQSRLLEVRYWPAGEPVPVRFAAWDHAGTWEVRDIQGRDAVMWRDFTKAEREQMGEIDEVRFAVAKTLHGMIHDVEAGRFLKWISENHAKKTAADLPPGACVEEASESMWRPLDPDAWVQVPDSKIHGTAVARYGALAGRFVPVPVWNDVRQSTGRQRPIGGPLWASILRAWKISKTALSPAVHMNNVAANVVMADWADVGVLDLTEALTAIVRAGKDPAYREILNRFEDAGGGGGMFAVSELQREQLEPLLDALRKEYQTAGQATGMVGIHMALRLLAKREWRAAYDAATTGRTARGTRAAVKAMIDLYQSEDVVFRLAKWVKEKRAGASDEAAAKAARDAFLNYEINAPWVQVMRQTAFPFVAFTYRAAPMLWHVATHKPWKLLKLGLVYGTLNAIGYALSGGDEDKERKLLPEEKAGRLYGVLGPKLVRMPWNDAHDQPVFLDVRRWIPAGDLVDMGQTHGAVPIFPFLVPSGPLALLGEVAMNHSQFTGKPIVKATDTGVERSQKVADHLYKAFAPNLPFLPGTYAWKSIVEAGSGKTDPFGRELSLGQAAASSVGVKLASYAPDAMLRQVSGKRVAELREIQENVSALTREFQRKGISAEEYQAKLAAQRAKARAVDEEFNKRMR